MAIATASLNLLAFPQHWDGVGLTVRFLCLPQGDPRAPLQPGLISFADANLQFEARLIGSLDHLPRAADASPVGPLLLDEPPEQKAALFAELEEHQFKIKPDEPPPLVAPPTPSFRKAVTASYRELVGSRQLSRWLTEEKDYECALHLARDAQPLEPEVLSDELAWGELLAFALRQPKLATALGLIGQTRVVPADADFYARGGWLHIGLHASGDLADDPALVSSFAARIPPLAANAERYVYAALLFPVDDAGVADEAFQDAERYDRGFARLVHAAQGGEDGDGIRLAWDDEQIAEAFARQVAATSSRPMGTAGFRVDVQDAEGDGTWHSLERVTSLDDLKLGELVIGRYEGEAVVEVVPVQPSPALPTDFWMPPYFCTWRGSSLVLTDPDLTRLHQRPDFDPAFDSMRLGREKTFAPVGDKDVPLLYGHSYRFRVRLADLSYGGPDFGVETPDEPDADAHHTVEVAFQRHRPPGAIQVMERPTRENPRVLIAKPQLRHPELLFTGTHSFADLEAALDGDVAADRQREPSLPDPDVLKVAIRLEVRALKGDRATWLPLYETAREFDAAELTLELETQDFATLIGLAEAQPHVGPLLVPTARDLRLVLVALGRNDPGYFASDDARHGAPVSVEIRAAARAEDALFAAEPQLTSFFFRQVGSDEAVQRPLARMAQELDLGGRELTLTGRSGHRTIFGCANALRHILSPERSSLTLASDADLSQRWINVLQFELTRDWTWDDLVEEGLTVQRRLSRPGLADEVEIAGTVSVPRTLTPAILIGVGDSARAPERSFSRVVFVDAVDPKPKPGEFPSELTVSYEIAATLRGDLPPPDMARTAVLLPITTPPVQVPHLVSAGIALSPHEPADDYSATNQRERMLWLEFDALPADPKDTYFVRVLASAADPLLTDEAIAELVPEPALPLDDERMRVITPEQPRDDNGLRAMQPLLRRSDDGAHFLIPLPDGLEASSPELFNMFTYEVRLGHTDERWSTAHGRFGPPLRVAGVQHPPPPLVCQAARGLDFIRVRAPFATPVQDGRHVRPPLPKTELWALLYVRVEQADAVAWRNLLLLRTPLFTPGPWSTASPYPIPDGRYGFAQTATHFYVFGGVSNGTRVNNVNRMDLATGMWQSRAPMPFTSEAPTCALMASTGIVYCTEGDTGSGFASYNIATDTWTLMAPIPGGDHYGSASGAFNGKVFVAGGTTGIVSTVHVYDVATNMWSAGTAAPSAFLLAGYQQVGQFLYVVGGFDPSGPNAAELSSVLNRGQQSKQPKVPDANKTTTFRLDMTSAPGVWTTGPAFTQGRADFGLAYDAGTNKLYALGGDAPGGGFFDSTNLVDELSVASWPAGTWRPSPPNLLLPNRQANQAGFYGAGQIWSVGGLVGQTFQFLAEVQRRTNGGAPCGTPPPFDPFNPFVPPPPGDTQPPLLYGDGEFLLAEVQRILRRRGLADAAPLTALVVEFHTQRCRPNQPEIEDPLGKHLGHARILRVSPLVPIPDAC